jgi:hypothetical protein
LGALGAGPAAPVPSARIGPLQEKVGRRALRLLTASRSTVAERRRASRSFNQGVMLCALADWAGSFAEIAGAHAGVPGAAALEEAARRCVADLERPATAEVAALDAVIADLRGACAAGGQPLPALQQMGELVLALHAARRPRRTVALVG